MPRESLIGGEGRLSDGGRAIFATARARASLLFIALVASASSVRADPPCRLVEVHLQPIPNLQIAAWVEDAQGDFVDTIFVTRMTGTFGLGNRPGNHLFRSDVRFPYGRRDMVLPVWAHARNHSYRQVVMGGKSGNSIASCARYPLQENGVNPGWACQDGSIGYHGTVSSFESFYCSPIGGTWSVVDGVDVVSCASSFTSCKGAWADAPAISLYPPRADLTSFDQHDSDDARLYAAANDLGAISGATPLGNALVDPPLRWTPPRDGAFVAKVELSLEGDFNPFNHHPSATDTDTLNGFGHDFAGQPSVVYAVPFTVGASADVEIAASYSGYGDWDGATGAIHPPDSTITDMPGSGAGRLLENVDASGSWRVLVSAQPTCGATACLAPAAPAIEALAGDSGTVALNLTSAQSGEPAVRFDVRYRLGDAPIGENDFLTALPSSVTPPPPGAPGTRVSTILSSLPPQATVQVAARALSACDAPSPVASTSLVTSQRKFATLSGCFIATAAFGTPLAHEVQRLRRLRDQQLLDNALGRLAVTVYYALSPPLARAIAGDARLRAGTRALLNPLLEALARPEP